MTPATSAPPVRRRLSVAGLVQGVGFRPHVARLAGALEVGGWCRNTSTGVVIEVEGDRDQVARFVERLRADLPPLARIDRLIEQDVAPQQAVDFAISPSASSAGARALVPPDTAVCDECVGEMWDVADRRHRHPFITCTNCGPRLSITREVPYDRPVTSLRDFPLCPACAAEYSDPSDRRFHAQPIGCHDCGPTVWFADPAGEVTLRREDALGAAVAALVAGKILAVKGIGGYHLVCDATSSAAVTHLRRRKSRPDKPFAVMVQDLRVAAHIVTVDGAAEVLGSPGRPIVLLPRVDSPEEGFAVAEEVAPGLGELGVMLAYAPLHHLLLADLAAATGRPSVLVVTSGNAAGEPLTYRDEDVAEMLGPLVDGILGHNREIVVPVEDSVVAWAAATGPVPIRRSRGYAPLPIALTSVLDSDPSELGSRGDAGPVVLAAGAELKNTVALAAGGQVHLSGHVGDLETLSALRAHQAVTDQLLAFHRGRPQVLVADLHPGYASSAWARRYAEELGVEVIEVQHHHAHLASL
ncbi:MAG: carbamoyltransferase HypF, partial [Actinomycetia bacterium]|nr:carbamoyltransferase HypF [Actinomycetes bacterium]